MQKPGIYVADSGVYSESNMRQLNEQDQVGESCSGDLKRSQSGVARRQLRQWQQLRMAASSGPAES